MEPAPVQWLFGMIWRGPPAPLVLEGPFCALCTDTKVDRCPCNRPACGWLLCTACAQRRFAHTGRWELPGNLLVLGCLGPWGPGGRGLGNIQMSGGRSPRSSVGIPPLSVSPIQHGGSRLFRSSPPVFPSPGLPVGLPVGTQTPDPVFPGPSQVFFKESGRVRWVLAVTPAVVTAPVANIIARFL